jgi:hypothetical protein
MKKKSHVEGDVQCRDLSTSNGGEEGRTSSIRSEVRINFSHDARKSSAKWACVLRVRAPKNEKEKKITYCFDQPGETETLHTQMTLILPQTHQVLFVIFTVTFQRGNNEVQRVKYVKYIYYSNKIKV